jgi:hypothetical protein
VDPLKQFTVYRTVWGVKENVQTPNNNICTVYGMCSLLHMHSALENLQLTKFQAVLEIETISRNILEMGFTMNLSCFFGRGAIMSF